MLYSKSVQIVSFVPIIGTVLFFPLRERQHTALEEVIRLLQINKVKPNQQEAQ